MVATTALVVITLAGCASGQRPAASTTTPSSAPAMTGASVRELPDDPVDLPAGRFARPDLVPGVSLEVTDGWSSGPLGDGTIEIQRQAGAGLVRLRIAALAVDSVDEVASAVEMIPGISVLASSESRMSGLTGPNLELENSTDAGLDLLTTASGPIELGPGERAWLSLFSTANGALAIVVTTDAIDWDDALLAAEPVLESVRIDP